MNKVRACEDLKQIEDALRRDAALTIRLLRFVNSASFNLVQQVHSVRQALAVIGLQSLYRWLSLLLVTASEQPTMPLLARTAACRGRICELLGSRHHDAQGQEELFITGMFSLIDALLDAPMASILERTPLPEPVNAALLHRRGPYAPYLSLIEACEKQNFADIEQSASALGLDPAEVNAAQLQAMAWADGLALA
ncbi:MAG: HDOD domain-containing protein [Pseudomonadota bacterium]